MVLCHIINKSFAQIKTWITWAESRRTTWWSCCTGRSRAPRGFARWRWTSPHCCTPEQIQPQTLCRYLIWFWKIFLVFVALLKLLYFFMTTPCLGIINIKLICFSRGPPHTHQHSVIDRKNALKRFTVKLVLQAYIFHLLHTDFWRQRQGK